MNEEMQLEYNYTNFVCVCKYSSTSSLIDAGDVGSYNHSKNILLTYANN